jgi:lysozyme family protein
MDRNFARALPLVLKYEGGWSDDPKDPGGATMRGVTLAAFRRYVKADATKDDLRKITDAQVSTVYYRNYWTVVNAAALPAGVDFCVFDFAVNSGPSRAAKYLQAVVGAKQDGKIGPATVAAVTKMGSAVVINRLCDKRLAFLRSLKTWSRFGSGWESRVAQVRRAAIDMVGNPADVVQKLVTVPKPVPTVPETVDHAVKNQTRGWGWSGVGFGGVGAAITAATGLDWRVIAIFVGVAVVGGIVALVVGPQIVRRVKAIRQEIEA